MDLKKLLEKNNELARAEMELANYKGIVERSQDVEELRNIQGNIETVKEKIETLRGEVDTLTAELEKEAEEKRAKFNPVGTYSNQTEEPTEEELRFKDFVVKGEVVREDGTATTMLDTPFMVPTKLMNIIKHNLTTFGDIYRRVSITNLPTKQLFPIVDFLMAEARIIGDNEVSDTQKLTADKEISFGAYGLEVRLAQSIFSNVMSLDEFNKLFGEQAALALLKKLDELVIAGTGGNQITGIVNTEDVKVVELSDDDLNFTGMKKLMANMKKAYSNYVMIMNETTFQIQIDGMVDGVGRPLVKEPVAEGELYKFRGKEIITVDDNVIKAYDEATSGEVVAVFADLKKFVINQPMKMEMVKWKDHDTNQIKTKAMMSCDGKLLDPKAALVIKKK